MTKEEREQLFRELIHIVQELGWTVAIPQGPDEEEVAGMVIGTSEYVDDVMEALDERSQ